MSKHVWLGESYPIRDPETIKTLLTTLPDSEDTRSEWRWFRLADGDLIAGFYPQGEMYFETEAVRDQDFFASEKNGTLRILGRTLEDDETFEDITYTREDL